MKLNRTQALFLVGTIAAVGCVVESSDDDGAGDDNEAGAGGSAGSAGSATGGKGGSSGSSGTAGTSTGGTSGSGGEGGAATCLGDERDPQVTCGDFMGAGGEGYGGGAGAGPTCGEMADAQTEFCTDLWTNLKPAVANDARTCMNAQSPEDVCSWVFTYGCAQEAILAACPDDTADDECQTIYDDCPEIPVSECSLVLSGMTQAGRDAVVACEYCDLWFCAGAAE
jgi:hypothetical protein